MTAASPPAPTRDRILDAAEILFAERGLAGTAVRDIASEVGLNPASLYNHFPSKLALYEAVLERGVRPLLEVLHDTTAADDDTRAADDRRSVLTSEISALPRFAR